MKIVLFLLLYSFVGYSQQIKTKSIVPYAVEMNSTLRICLSENNFIFVFNNISDFENGVSKDLAIDISSSRNWNLNLIEDSLRTKFNYKIDDGEYFILENKKILENKPGIYKYKLDLLSNIIEENFATDFYLSSIILELTTDF